MKDGWKTVTMMVQDEDWTEETFDLYIEDGKVLRGTDTDHTETLYPYKANGHGWENATGVRYETFRDGYKKGAYCMK